MAIITWFLWHRWRFIGFARGFPPEPFLSNALKINFLGCGKYPVICRDMQHIIKSNAGANQ